MNQDSIELLKQCNSGCKNGTNSMEQVMDYVKDDKLEKLINDYNKKIAMWDSIPESLKTFVITTGRSWFTQESIMIWIWD